MISLFKHGQLRRINILEGSVRSGKTWISLVLWALWVASMPADAAYLMVAKTITSLERNCLDLLQTLVGAKNFNYNTNAKKGRLFGRLIYFEGVNDARAENKIRGMTLQGAYCDELTLFTEDFFTMLLSRLSMPEAKLIGTTNPDNPGHWLKEKYLDRRDELDMLVLKYLIDDNTSLPKSYVENLKKEYTGVFYDRFILGMWKPTEGVIYLQFADDPSPWLVTIPTEEVARKAFMQSIDFISIGVDFGGNKSLTAFVATAIHRGYKQLTALKNHHIKGRKGDIDSDRVNREFIDFVQQLQTDYPGCYIRYCFADSAEQYLINSLRKACRSAGLNIGIGDSDKNEVVQRIVCTNTLLNTKRLFINKECELLISGLKYATWDTSKVKDARLDNFSSDIDILDAFEYSFERFMPKLLPNSIRKG